MVKCDFCGKKIHLEGKKKDGIKTKHGSVKYIRFMCNNCKKKEEKEVGYEIEEVK